MGFYFRKSINLGPLRINLSKSGIGVSFGVKGARVSLNKKGVGLNAGKNGVYYKKNISYKKLGEAVGAASEKATTKKTTTKKATTSKKKKEVEAEEITAQIPVSDE